MIGDLFSRVFGPTLQSCLDREKAANEREQACRTELTMGKDRLEMARVAIERTVAERNAAEARAQAAEARAQAAEERAVRCIAEARQALTESYALSRVAAQAVFGLDKTDIENPPSVAEADRRAAARVREARG